MIRCQSKDEASVGWVDPSVHQQTLATAHMLTQEPLQQSKPPSGLV